MMLFWPERVNWYSCTLTGKEPAGCLDQLDFLNLMAFKTMRNTKERVQNHNGTKHVSALVKVLPVLSTPFRALTASLTQTLRKWLKEGVFHASAAIHGAGGPSGALKAGRAKLKRQLQKIPKAHWSTRIRQHNFITTDASTQCVFIGVTDSDEDLRRLEEVLLRKWCQPSQWGLRAHGFWGDTRTGPWFSTVAGFLYLVMSFRPLHSDNGQNLFISVACFLLLRFPVSEFLGGFWPH